LTGFSIVTILFVLLTASLVAIISRRARLPYSVGLVTAGIVLPIFGAICR
jgi:CPA1 family monovalent cation:H+ antiporter